MRIDVERQYLQAHLQSPTNRVQCRTNKRLCKGDDTDAIRNPVRPARSFRTPFSCPGFAGAAAYWRPTCDRALPSFKPAPKGYTRALSKHLQHSLISRCARGGCQGPSFPRKLRGPGGRENRLASDRSRVRPSPFFSKRRGTAILFFARNHCVKFFRSRPCLNPE
jgi:hypothetical protein